MTNDVSNAILLLHKKMDQNGRKIHEIEACDIALDYFVRNPTKEGNPFILVKFAMLNAYKKINNRSKIIMQCRKSDYLELAEYNKKFSTNDLVNILTVEFNDFIMRLKLNDVDKLIANLLLNGWDSRSIAEILNWSVSRTRVRISRIRKKLYTSWRVM